MKWVYGADSALKDHVHYVENQETRRHELVYSCGGRVAVCLDPEQETQRHVSMPAKVSCIGAGALDGCGLVALGDVCGNVRVVGSERLDVKAAFSASAGAGASASATATAAVDCIQLHRSRTHLACAFGAGQVAVFDWARGSNGLLYRYTASCPVLAMQWTGAHALALGEGSRVVSLAMHNKHVHEVRSHDVGARVTALLLGENNDNDDSDAATLIVGDAKGALRVLPAELEPPLQLAQVLGAHGSSVVVLKRLPDGSVLSGGEDALMKRWGAAELEALETIDTSMLTSARKAAPSIRALGVSSYGMGNKKSRVAFGNSIGQILVVDLESGQLAGTAAHVAQAHPGGDGSVAVAVSPKDPTLLCTVGDDEWLTLYKRSRVQLRLPLDAGARSVGFSPDGDLLAVGMTGAYVAVYRVVNGGQELERVFESGDAHASKGQGVVEVKFSPDGAALGVAYANNVETFTVNPFAKATTYDDHNFDIVHFDFSSDGLFTQSLDTGGHLFRVKVSSGALMPDKAQRKAAWAATTVPAGKGFEELYLCQEQEQKQKQKQKKALGEEGKTEEKLFYAARPCVARSGDGALLVSSTAVDGELVVLPFPVPAGAVRQSVQHVGHPSAVRQLLWNKERATVLSVGADVCAQVVEWDVVKPQTLALGTVVVAEDWAQLASEANESSEAAEEAPKVAALSLLANFDPLSSEKQMEGLKMTKTPDWSRGQVTGPPAYEVALHGAVASAKGDRCWRPAFSRSHGRVVSTGGLFGMTDGLFGSDAAQMQTQPLPRNGATAVDRAADLVATVTAAGICVWEAGSCATLALLPRDSEDGAEAPVALAWVPGAEALVVLAPSTLTVWRAGSAGDWTCAPVLESVTRVAAPASWVHASQSSILVGTAEGRLCVFGAAASAQTGGAVHVSCSDPKSAKKSSKRGATARTTGVELAFTCGVALARSPSAEGDPQSVAAVATNTGGLFLLTASGARHAAAEDAAGRGAFVSDVRHNYVHNSSRLSSEEVALLVSGDSRGTVKLWDAKDLVPLRAMTASMNVPSLAASPPLRARIVGVDADSNGSRVLAACRSGEVFVLSPHTGSVTNVLQRPAPSCESWALCVNPMDPALVATANDDGVICVWELASRVSGVAGGTLVERHVPDDQPAAVRALAWSPDGLLIAAGLGDDQGRSHSSKVGSFYVLNAATLEVFFQGRDSKAWIRAVRFAPNGKQLAVASADGNAYLYDAESGFKLTHVCEGEGAGAGAGGVMAMDFASESLFLRCMDATATVRVFNCSNGEVIADTDELANVRWATHTILPAWGSQAPGLCRGKKREGDVGLVDDAAICVGKDDVHDLVACGTLSGALRLANFPALKGPLQVASWPAHQGAVGAVVFVPATRSLVSLGAHDGALLHWRLTKAKAKAKKEPKATKANGALTDVR